MTRSHAAIIALHEKVSPGGCIPVETRVPKRWGDSLALSGERLITERRVLTELCPEAAKVSTAVFSHYVVSVQWA